MLISILHKVRIVLPPYSYVYVCPVFFLVCSRCVISCFPLYYIVLKCVICVSRVKVVLSRHGYSSITNDVVTSFSLRALHAYFLNACQAPVYNCNMAFSVHRYFEEDRDEILLGWLWKALLAFIALASLIGRIPYGRYSGDKGLLSRLMVSSFKLPARQAWVVQEIPSLAVPLILLLIIGGRYVGAINPNMILLGMFLLHYANR